MCETITIDIELHMLDRIKHRYDNFPRMLAALEEARKTMRNARGGIETGQTADKQIPEMLTRGVELLDAAIAAAESGQ